MTEQAAASKRAAQEKRRAEKRLTELDNLLAKIYEDRVNEKITERNFSMLSQKYQQEQGKLEKKIEALTAGLLRHGGLGKPVQYGLLVLMNGVNPVLQTGEDIGIKHIIPDVVYGALVKTVRFSPCQIQHSCGSFVAKWHKQL